MADKDNNSKRLRSPRRKNSSRVNSNVETGAILVLAVVAVYLMGCFWTMLSLPDASWPRFARHMGDTFNLYHESEWESAESETFPDFPSPHKDKIEIPTAVWPVPSILGEDYETITHPGDTQHTMEVPKFWSPPVHNGQLMTRAQALQIGSCLEPDARGNFARGDDCPLDQRTIYVGIASFRDFQCRSTVESIFLRAKHPERVRIGVVDQIVKGEDSACNGPI